jgi:hypothetical protein
VRFEVVYVVAAQDPLVQLLQPGAGVDAQVLGEPGADHGVRVQGFGRAAGMVKREHELGSEPFPVGVLLGEPAEFADQLGGAAEGQLRVGEAFEGRKPHLFQDRTLAGGQRLGGAAERRAWPHRQRVPELLGGRFDPAAGEIGGGPSEGNGERIQVQLTGRDVHTVAGRLADDRVPADDLAQPGHVDLQLRAGVGGQVGAPHQGAQLVVGNHPVGPQQ